MPLVETATIIGLISSFVTFEECLWAKLPLIGRFCKKKKILSKNWKSDNIVVQACVERFKDDSWSEYREHIFNEDEKQKIVRGYFEHNPDLKLNAMDRKSVELFIVRILDGFNEYNRSVMTPGERILQDSVSKGNEKILSSLEELKNQGREDNKRKFIRAVNHYKNDDAPNIDCKINGFYEIDRSTTINQIKKDGCRLISIIGAPGSGKTVLCKKLLENEENVLYARAERVATCNNISEIWNCDLESLLENGFQEKLYIFIDALEFIADNSETVKNKLQEIFSLSRDYPNVCVVTSCRTSDKNSFAKLWSNYNVKDYEISELNDGEIESIIQAFPCLKKMKGQKGYSDLLKIPFYVNLIVSKIGDDFEIKDENELRTFIWENVICLRSKASEYGVVSSEIKNAVEMIVFERARKFTPGVNKEDLNSKILNILLSEKIVVQNGDLVRLSYDIFEDICFEHTFDRLFVDCKGDYSRFFNDIESYGRCAYRRYQIWISNKILASDSREKFLHELIFSNYENDGWKQQTQIGIVKSKYSNLFFEQYSQKLVDENLLVDFLKIVNLYGFEGTVAKNSFDYAQISLKPVGNSRECLIKIIESNNLYKNSLNEADVLKLCADYSKVEHRNTETSNAVCKIVEYYYDLKKSEKEQYWYCKSDKDLTPYLNILYQLSDSAKEWLKLYLQELKEGYASQNREIQLWSEKLIEWTLVKNVNPNLVKELPNELCELADAFWLLSGKLKKQKDYERIDTCGLFGLSENASDHLFSVGRQHFVLFFACLQRHHFWIAFNWALNFVNKAVLNYSKTSPDSISECEILCLDKDVSKSYLGNANLWLCTYVENNIPLLISDVLYQLKNFIIRALELIKDDLIVFKKSGENIKNFIYEKSNNIAALSLILDIGLHFKKELPGFALDLATNIDFIFWDINRYALYHKNDQLKLIESQISKTIGVPSSMLIPQYELNPKCDILLQHYVLLQQLGDNEELRRKCGNLLRFLYSKYENDTKFAKELLQVEKMDSKKTLLTVVEKDVALVRTDFSDGAKSVASVAMEKNKKLDGVLLQYSQMMRMQSDGSVDYAGIDKIIDLIIGEIAKNDDLKVFFEDKLINLIFVAIANQNIASERRDFLCGIWIDCLYRYFKNETFVSDHKLVGALFAQLKIKGVSRKLKDRIKRLILDLIIYKGHHGIIEELKNRARLILEYDAHLAQIFFNTIVMLSIDEMSHRKYNFKTLYQFNHNSEREFVPYEDFISDWALNNLGLALFVPQENAIVQKYLYDEEPLDCDDFNIEDCDLSFLCFIADCGMNLDDATFSNMVVSLLKEYFRLKNDLITRRNSHEYLNFSDISKIEHLYQRAVKNGLSTRNIDLLFDDIDFSNFSNDSIELYLRIFGELQAIFFDGYENRNDREIVLRLIKYLECKVNQIQNKFVRENFFKFLCFSVSEGYVGDWSKFKTSFSHDDKLFINEQFIKYGKFNLSEMFIAINKFHPKDLLPEILLSVKDCLRKALNENNSDLLDKNGNTQYVVEVLTTEAYFNYADKIKNDESLTIAYEGVLDVMIAVGAEYAAVLKDEFRVH